MEISPLLLQFGGSLVAIALLAWLALALRLGPKPKLENAEQAARAASEAVDGFVPTECAVAQESGGALLRDGANQIMLLKSHGAHFAGRILDERAGATVAGDMLIIDSGETHFGSVSLVLSEPEIWADAINRLSKRCHA